MRKASTGERGEREGRERCESVYERKGINEKGEQKRRDEYRDEKEKESVEGAERRKNDV